MLTKNRSIQNVTDISFMNHMYPIYSRLMIPHWKCNVTDNSIKRHIKLCIHPMLPIILSTKLVDETVATIISFQVTK